MTDHLTRLVERSIGVGEVVRPRPASLFEPHDALEDPVLAEGSVDSSAETPAPDPERLSAPPRAPLLPPVSAPPPSQPVPQPEQLREPHAQPEHVPALPAPAPPPEVAVERSTPTDPQPVPAASAPLPPMREPSLAGQPAGPATPPIREASAWKDPPRRAPVTPRFAVVRERERERLVRTPHPAPERLRGSEPQSQSVPWVRAASVRPAGRAASPAAAEPPVVRVTIGRVDVRAVPPPARPDRPAPKRRPRLTLDEYLRKDGER